MIRSVLMTAVTLAAFTALPAAAQEHEGLWMGNGEGELTVDLNHIQDDQYGIDITTTVPISEEFTGCGGGISGEVLLDSDGGNFFVENEGYIGTEPESAYNMRYCEIGLEFDGNGQLVIEEKSGCMYYHGASCSFTGTLEHDSVGV